MYKFNFKINEPLSQYKGYEEKPRKNDKLPH